MEYRFYPQLPEGVCETPPLISGEHSRHFDISSYLVVSDAEGNESRFQIRRQYSGLPFNQILVEDGLLAVGHQGHFYLFDVAASRSLVAMELDGYFCGLYYYQQKLFVTTACSVICFEQSGSIFWIQSNVGIDGVIIENFDGDKIYGSGEWDPPGGWIDFILDVTNGKVLES